MRAAALLLGLLLLTGAAVFPPMVGGEFSFHVQPANEFDPDGVPLYPATRSIGIAPEAGGALVACVDTPDQTTDYYVTASLSATGVRQAFKAYAYDEPGCQGLVSTASVNTAYTYPGQSPHDPDLL